MLILLLRVKKNLEKQNESSFHFDNFNKKIEQIFATLTKFILETKKKYRN